MLAQVSTRRHIYMSRSSVHHAHNHGNMHVPGLELTKEVLLGWATFAMELTLIKTHDPYNLGTNENN